MNSLNEIFRYSLTDTGESGILRVKDGYAICPICGRKKLARIHGDSFVSHLGLWCRICGEVNITISPEL